MKKNKNYDEINNILDSRFEEVNGYDFYRFIFPNNENKGELNYDYSKPNAVYLYQDDNRDKDSNLCQTYVKRCIKSMSTYVKRCISFIFL